MRINRFAIIFCLLAVPLVIGGCGKSISEKAAEKIIENAGNGEVKVDIDNQKTTIETEAGIGEVGENVSVPEDFPDDVYLIDGVVKTSYKNSEENGWTLSIETDKSIADVRALYETKLEEAGWTINSFLDMGTAATLGGVKDNRNISLMISADADSGKTTVIVGVTENK